ncbi:MAG TPA: hypothetical protein VFV34_03045 [Blastocatellia bacterium]|nr:hypothetical protein [Blastocatellia bacterium]
MHVEEHYLASFCNLSAVAGRQPIKTATGVAVPAIEAWYSCGIDPQVNEAAWNRKLQGEACTYSRLSLKKNVYGTERPSIKVETERASQAALGLVDRIEQLEMLFPSGFGAFATDLRNW